MLKSRFNSEDIIGQLITGNSESFIVKSFDGNRFYVDVVAWNDDDEMIIERENDVKTVSEIEHEMHFMTGKSHKFSYFI